MQTRAMQATIRFGLGRRGQAPLPADPEGWLRAQVAAADGARFPPDLPDSAEGLRRLRDQRRMKLQGDPLVGPLFQADAMAQMAQALASDQPFRERLVWFWANHFTVSLRQGGTRATIGPYVREAIRPHVTGRFSDMLLAVMRHPAMLMYLDNASSIGPDSPAAQAARRHGQARGLNENLARECLELHTLSPAAGYTQQDVTAFAAILTGWTVDLRADPPGFAFRAAAHQPGDKQVMGRIFPPGEEGGIQALRWLADHPATHRHLAVRLATHFIADTPPPAAIQAIAAALRDSGGDLGAAAVAVVARPEAWHTESWRTGAGHAGTKLRMPWQYALAALRALDPPPTDDPHRSPARLLMGAMAQLGQPLWNAPLPNGWSDRAADWSAPSDMIARADWAYGLAGRDIAAGADPLDIAHASLGPVLRPATLAALSHAASRRDALTLLFTAPEFQRL
ncbi:DUF1800 domain-containing protein [Gluconacetobacter diazotrophicus]|uniref:DUF1800 domain-containing protein n=1 Tax=Gluconacetobacter diazotrophicus TaxID=33996 RepID=A0A7W4NFL7_GLUDI|nr:DUF1800 domain-containing protein [Gluconacetobacter diazotrophicus]MBB2156837.1 DUF1800 domain-containing protein [Gluconacetobacter diazotrophicus]